MLSINNNSIDFNGNPVLYHGIGGFNFVVGLWNDLNTAAGLGVEPFDQINIHYTVTDGGDEFTEIISMTWAQFDQALHDDLSFPVSREYAAPVFVSAELTYGALPVVSEAKATLFYFNDNYRLVHKEFTGEQVEIEEFSFIASIIKDGIKVSPTQFENIDDQEIFALSSHFFDLNVLEDGALNPPRVVTLIGLRSIYDAGLSQPLAGNLKVEVQNQVEQNSGLWICPRYGYVPLNHIYNANLLGKYCRMHVTLSLNNPRFDCGDVEDNNFFAATNGYNYCLGVDEALPFDNMEFRFAPRDPFVFVPISGKSNGILTFEMFGYYMYVMRNSALGGPGTVGLPPFVLDLVSGNHGIAPTTGSTAGVRQLKDGFYMSGSNYSAAYSADLEIIKALAIAEKARLGL